MLPRTKRIPVGGLAALVIGCSGSRGAPIEAPVPAPVAVSSPEPAPPAPEQVREAPDPVAPPVALVAVVEGGYAWVRRYCESDQPLTPEESKLPEWASLQLQLLSSSGVRPVRLEPPVCVEGGCNVDQVGLPVGEGDGVLFRADPQAPALEPLTHLYTEEGTAPPGGLPVCPDLPDTEEPNAPIEDCFTYVSAGDGSRAVQVHGKGFVQENQWPMYETIEARLLQREGDKWVSGAWGPMGGGEHTLPWPVGQTTGPVTQVVWLASTLGESSAWISTFAEKGWVRIAEIEGGYGQECD